MPLRAIRAVQLEIFCFVYIHSVRLGAQLSHTLIFSLGMLTSVLVRRTAALGVGAQTRRSVSAWSGVIAGPPDPILGTILFQPVKRNAGLHLLSVYFIHMTYLLQACRKPSRQILMHARSTSVLEPTGMNKASLISCQA